MFRVVCKDGEVVPVPSAQMYRLATGASNGFDTFAQLMLGRHDATTDDFLTFRGEHTSAFPGSTDDPVPAQTFRRLMLCAFGGGEELSEAEHYHAIALGLDLKNSRMVSRAHQLDVVKAVFRDMTLSSELKSPLEFQAIDSNNDLLLECVLRRMGSEASARSVNAAGCNLLVYACARDKPECVRVILNLDAVPVDAASTYSRTGAFVLNARTSITPLAMACKRGHVACAALLLDAKADVSGTYAMKCACAGGYVACIDLLIAHGAKVSGTGALHAAARSNQIGVLGKLLDEGLVDDINELCPQGSATALVEACEAGATECMRFLLAKGADPNIVANEHDGKTALVLAADMGNLECVRALIECDLTDLDFADHEGHTALMLACEYGNTEIVRALLDAEASHDVVDEEGIGALYSAMSLYDITDPDPSMTPETKGEIVRMLLEYGASADGPEGKVPPVHGACLQGNAHCLGILIDEGGAQVDLTTESAVATALHVAVDQEMVGDPETEALRARMKCECIKKLVDAGADIKSRHPEHGTTPLMVACDNGFVQGVRALLDAGAGEGMDEERCNDGLTALEYAERGDHVECVELLQSWSNRRVRARRE